MLGSGPSIGPSDLVAVHLPPGDAWPVVVADLWDRGAALLPVDHRLPPAARRELLERARPTFLLDVGGWHRLEGGRGVETECAAVVPTSGSTGLPKLVELPRSALEAAVRLSTRTLALTPDTPWLCPIPPSHVGGLLVVLRGVLTGGGVTVRPRLDPTDVAAAEGCAVALVPTQLRRLCQAGCALERFAVVLVGGQALDARLRQQARTRGARLVATYGQTETCGGVVYDGVPFPGVDVRLGAEGEIEVKGPTLMRGYRFDAVATASAFTPDGWLRTGDVGRLRSRRLEVVGRLREVIVSGGEKIWPHRVEAVLRSHPGIAEVAVVGRPDAEYGERVVALVVARDRSHPPSLGELRDHVSRSLPRYMAPREVVVVDHLKTTPLGKVRRPPLGTGR